MCRTYCIATRHIVAGPSANLLCPISQLPEQLETRGFFCKWSIRRAPSSCFGPDSLWPALSPYQSRGFSNSIAAPPCCSPTFLGPNVILKGVSSIAKSRSKFKNRVTWPLIIVCVGHESAVRWALPNTLSSQVEVDFQKLDLKGQSSVTSPDLDLWPKKLKLGMTSCLGKGNKCQTFQNSTSGLNFFQKFVHFRNFWRKSYLYGKYWHILVRLDNGSGFNLAPVPHL